MKKSTILLSTLVLGLTLTSPAYARSHGGAHGHHSSHGSHHSPHISHDSHISGHKSPSKSPSTKSPSTKSPSKSPSTKSPSTNPSTKSSKSTDSSKSTKSTNPSKSSSKSTKKDYSIKHPYNDQEAFDVFKSNKLQSSYQKAYRRQSIFNNPWIWMYFISHHNNQYHASHNKVNTEYAKGYRDGWTKGETTTDPYKENKSLRYQSKNYRQGYKDGYMDAQKQRKD